MASDRFLPLLTACENLASERFKNFFSGQLGEIYMCAKYGFRFSSIGIVNLPMLLYCYPLLPCPITNFRKG